MSLVDTLVEKHGAHLMVSESEVGWLARLEWVTSARWWRAPEIHGAEAHGSDRDAALLSLNAKLRRVGAA